jgi:TrmH family RNA methyltransferase
MTTLVSRKNPNIRQIRKLMVSRKERETTGLFVVEGIHHVGEAVEAHSSIAYICYAPDLLNSDFAQLLINEQERLGIPCLAVEGDTFTSLSGKENPQGIIAVVKQPRRQLGGLSSKSFVRGVALVAPQDPGNIGTILRTIDAVGASGLLILDDPANNQYCADPYHPSSVRASMGTIFWYPVVRAGFSEFVQWAKNNLYKVYGTSAHASQDYRKVEHFEQPLVLLMGSEREGLSPFQSAVCDMVLRIPMHGRVSSLNLAIATGIMLFTMVDKLGDPANIYTSTGSAASIHH